MGFFYVEKRYQQPTFFKSFKNSAIKPILKVKKGFQNLNIT